MVGLALAIDRPAIVESLVVSGAQARRHHRLVATQIAVMRLMPFARLVLSMATSIPVEWPELADASRADLAMTGKTRILQAIRDAGDIDLRASLPLVRCRTLVLCGSRDRFNLRAARLIAKAIPNAKLTIAPGVGHVWNLEAPERFNETLSAFL